MASKHFAVKVTAVHDDKAHDPPSRLYHPNWLTTWLLTWQFGMGLLFSFTTQFAPRAEPGSYDADLGSRYAQFMDVHVMMAVGFGFLYTLLRRYAWTGVSVNFLISALVLQWGVLCFGFWENVRARVASPSSSSIPSIPLSLNSMISGDYLVAVVLISFGAVIGRASPTQVALFAFVETIFAAGNMSLANQLKVSDAGGSMVIHTFGASFGLAFASVLGDKAAKGVGNGEAVMGTSRTQGAFAMIGTTFLFCLWPSFNAATLSGSAAERAVVNSLLSITASVVVAFAASRSIHGGLRFDMEHVQNATLAGGVAIGAACELITNPGGAVAVGAVSGLVSVYGFSHLSPLLKRRGITDVCGIANLHWMPGILGGLASAVAAAGVGAPGSHWSPSSVVSEFPGRAAGRSALAQGGFQAAVTFLSLFIGASTGAITALVLRSASWADPMATDFYEDGGTFNVPWDGEELPELESDVGAALAAERSVVLQSVLTIVGDALGKPLHMPSDAELDEMWAGGSGRGPAATVGGAGGGGVIPSALFPRSANRRFTSEASAHGGGAGMSVRGGGAGGSSRGGGGGGGGGGGASLRDGGGYLDRSFRGGNLIRSSAGQPPASSPAAAEGAPGGAADAGGRERAAE